MITADEIALSDNVKRSMEFNWSQGKWQALAPIGYLNIKDKEGKSQIIIDKERTPIIKNCLKNMQPAYIQVSAFYN